MEDLLHFRDALLSFWLLSPESTELLVSGKAAIKENSSYAHGFFDRPVGGQCMVGHGVGMNIIAFSPDGRLLASADVIWDVESKQAGPASLITQC